MATTPLRVLLVEDNPDDADLIILALSRGGYDPSWTRVETEAEMRAALAEGPWHAVLSDYTLPGFGAAQALVLARQADPEVPFIVITGTIGEEKAVVMMRAGASDYLLKHSLTRLASAVVREVEAAASRKAGRAAELLAQDVLDSLPAHVAVLDAGGRIIGVNAAWERFAQANGATGDARYGIGANYLEVCGRACGPDSAEATLTVLGISRVFRGELPSFTLEYPCHSPLEQRWFLLHASPLRPAGRGVVVAHTDITERKRAELVDRRLASIVESSADAIMSENMDGTITSWNPAAERLYGWTAEEAVGRHVSCLAPPEKIEEQAAILNRVRQREYVESFETLRMHRDGTRIDVAITHSPLQDKNGQLIGITKIVRDIREKRRAEEALRVSERRHRTLLDRIPDPLFAYDRETLRYMAVNDAAVATYGYTRDEFLGLTIRDIRPDGDVPALLQMLARSPGGFEDRGLWRHRKKDGTVFDVEITAHDIELDGRPACIISARDITERKRVEIALSRSEERLRLAAEATGLGIYDWDLLSNTLKWDEQFSAIFGVKSTQVPTLELFYNLLHPNDVGLTETRVRSALDPRGDGIYRAEYRVVHTGGNLRWVTAIGRVSFEGVGDERRPIRFVGTVLDITEQKHAEERLIESEAKLAEAVRIARMGYWSRDYASGVLEWSEQLFDIFGVVPEQGIRTKSV